MLTGKKPSIDSTGPITKQEQVLHVDARKSADLGSTVAAREKAPTPGVSREQIPVLGYRNYWYPAVSAKKIRRNPLQVKLLGAEVVIFRDSRNGAIHAFEDRCPHRGALLSQGRTYYPGTLTCPYHGWTFDTWGKLVAVLSEGPDCALTGKVQVRTYPLAEYRGLVWIWMGDQNPVPLEEDLPPELRDHDNATFMDIQVWRANWRVVTENTDGYHAPILHRRSLPRTLYMDWVAWRKIGVVEMEDGKGLVFVSWNAPERAEYPGLGEWPRNSWWERAARNVFRARMAKGAPMILADGRQAFVTEDIHLPGWRRVRVRRHTVFIEWAVPIDEQSTRHFLWDAINTSGMEGKIEAAKARLKMWLFRNLIYPTYWKWAYNKRYVGQDKRVLESLKEGPERLQSNDIGIIAWRRLAARSRDAEERAPQSTQPPADNAVK
jgi:phenylpropionate dioxygenase-like ring-hydroxylating dioxygenase large terminal subunit